MPSPPAAHEAPAADKQPPHPGPLTPQCPLECLLDVLPARPRNRLARAHGAPSGPPGTIGDVARLYARGELAAISGLGPRQIEDIAAALTRAGVDLTRHPHHPPDASPPPPPHPHPQESPAMPVPDATLRRWNTAGNKSQKVAAWLAAWAASQPPATIVPADDVIISRLPAVTAQNGLPSANTPASTRRAIRLLADRHVLYRDHGTGHYHVAATQPATTPSPRDRP